MRIRACIALLLLLSACAAPTPGLKRSTAQNRRIANLHRAAALPWRDQGRCAVHEASQPWPVLAERCFRALDHDRIRFHDPTGRCTVASADAAALGLGVCVLAAPEFVVGAVIVVGVVMVGVAIAEALDAYALKGMYPEETRPTSETEPIAQESSPDGAPNPDGASSGRDWFPPVPPGLEPRDRPPECTPRRIPPKGGHPLHNKCADNIPANAFRGANVLVNGKAFDALQPATRTLWEVKTNDIETYNPFIRQTELDKQVGEAQRERALAAACGYDFVIGVRSEAHKALLELADFTLKVVVMEWC
ncbi:hypothetical protein D7Y23_14360 [Corallococcus sp. AB050B]|nr:hypothetical protein D7Y23_14360 [Corallococcus sp. AB050B]